MGRWRRHAPLQYILTHSVKRCCDNRWHLWHLNLLRIVLLRSSSFSSFSSQHPPVEPWTKQNRKAGDGDKHTEATCESAPTHVVREYVNHFGADARHTGDPLCYSIQAYIIGKLRYRRPNEINSKAPS